MFTNALPSELAGLIGIIDPDAYAASTVTTGWVDMADFEHVMAVIMAGTLGAAATLAAKIEQATDAAGAGAKDITGKAITTLTQAGGGSDKQAVINLRGSELDIDGAFRFVRISMTIGVAASDAGAVMFGMSPKNGIASVHDLVSVAEIVR